MAEPLLWNIKETALQLGKVSTRTVRRLIERGELEAVRVGRCVRVPAGAAPTLAAGVPPNLAPPSLIPAWLPSPQDSPPLPRSANTPGIAAI